MTYLFIFSSTFEDHLSHVAQVLQTLRKAYLKIRIDKCQFARNSVEFLSHLIALDGIGPKERNIKAVTYFPTPAKIKDVCAFLGLCNHNRRFVKNYSVLARLLLQLLKKNAIFHWHFPQHESFMAFKERLTTAPIWPTRALLSHLPCIPTLVEIVSDLTLLSYNMVENEPLFMVDETFQILRKSVPSQNEKRCQ